MMDTTEERAVKLQTRDQRYAARVYEQARGVPPSLRSGYGSLAHKLPALARSAGLAQALAYVEARGGPAGRRLIDDLAMTTIGKNSETLLASSREVPLLEYLQLTRRVLAALDWYKRFTQAWADAADDEGGG